jgi:hypothetical protein
MGTYGFFAEFLEMEDLAKVCCREGNCLEMTAAFQNSSKPFNVE